MSEVKRYDLHRHGEIMEQQSDGDYVHFSDYEKLKAQLERAEEALKFYANEMNYSIDDYHGISGEMRTRCVLYSDCEERNDVYSYAGRRSREYFKKNNKGERNE